MHMNRHEWQNLWYCGNPDIGTQIPSGMTVPGALFVVTLTPIQGYMDLIALDSIILTPRRGLNRIFLIRANGLLLEFV